LSTAEVSLLFPAVTATRIDATQVLTDAIADVNLATERSRTTPLTLAARQGRLDVIKKLLQAKANPGTRDALTRSALFYASRMGHAKTVELLLKKYNSPNDGSLHEASRGFHIEVMEQLMNASHDPNYRSLRHHGRTALGEVALRGEVPEDIVRAEAAIDLLKKRKADPLVSVRNKTAIFLALDNHDPGPITELLLSRFLWETIHNKANLYVEGDRHYSPTMYVKKGLFGGTQEQAYGLLRLLTNLGVVDRYYASIDLDQPQDAVGLPEDIQKAEKAKREYNMRKRRDEEEHQTNLRRKREEAFQRNLIAEDELVSDLHRTESLATQRRRIKGLDHNQEIQIEAEKARNKAYIDLNAAATKSIVQWKQHRDERGIREERYQQGEWEEERSHAQKKRFTDDNHAQSLRHKEDRHAQDSRQLDNNRQLQLAHQYEEDRRQLSLEAFRSNHQLELERRRNEENIWARQHVDEIESSHMERRDKIQAQRDYRGLQATYATAWQERLRHEAGLADREA